MRLTVCSLAVPSTCVGAGDLTGVPVVLNTSFNDNEPIVCRPEEALECFRRTRMDVLVMGNFLLERKQSPADREEPAERFAKREH